MMSAQGRSCGGHGTPELLLQRTADGACLAASSLSLNPTNARRCGTTDDAGLGNRYGTGSGQQSVTGYEGGDDSNDYWVRPCDTAA
jgi:hypothetical protein